MLKYHDESNGNVKKVMEMHVRGIIGLKSHDNVLLLLLFTFDKLDEMGMIAIKFESARVRLLSNFFAAAVAVVFV